MTFQERVIEKIKRYFPEAKIINLVDPDGQNFGFGLAQAKHEGGGCLNKYYARTSDEDSDDDYSAEDDLVDNALEELWFYRSPDEIYIRSINSGEDKVIEAGCVKKYAAARFVMGYKA